MGFLGMEKISMTAAKKEYHAWLPNAYKTHKKTKEPPQGEVGRCGLYISVCVHNVSCGGTLYFGRLFLTGRSPALPATLHLPFAKLWN